jgi:hypothetical protein
MPVQAGQVLPLRDVQQRPVGEIRIERREGNLVFGRFVPGPAFQAVEHLFRAFEEAVNLQALSRVEELDAAIAALGLHLCRPEGTPGLAIQDVQIWSDGGATFRLCGPAVVNGSPGLAQPARPVLE